jgi:HAMP domain-containing protein
MVRALSLGGILALLTAAIGGWLIGRKTLQPLSDMATQAAGIDGREPSGRLSTPNPEDELGVLTASFNDLLQRLATALHQQRQFMADRSRIAS